MTAEKASTLKLLRAGMGKVVNVIETRGSDALHEVRAHLPGCNAQNGIPVLFLITTLAFLEAGPEVGQDSLSPEFAEVDGWTPGDFLSYMAFEDGKLQIDLEFVRGRSVFTRVTLDALGELVVRTQGRGQSATRWLAYVRGRRHLEEVAN